MNLDLTPPERRAFWLGFASNLAAFAVLACVVGWARASRGS